MRNIWAVARKTFLQCARTRIIVVFGILLAVCVLGTGFMMTGDGTLKGRIQTFLAYSTSLTQLFLCLVTIFMTTGIVTADIRRKYIFTVASKPLARWEYVIGRWLGVVMLNGLLLSAAMGSIYFIAQHLRKLPTKLEQDQAIRSVKQEKPDFDRLGVENEVFTARETFFPEPFDIDAVIKDKIKKLIDENGKDNLIRTEIAKKVDDTAKADELLKDPDKRRWAMMEIEYRLRKQMLDEIETIRPGRYIALIYAGLKPEQADGPLLQVRYKLNPLESSDTLNSEWRILNPQSGFTRSMSRSDAAKTTSSFMVNPLAVANDGKLIVFYRNIQNNTTVKIDPSEIAVLQQVGGFEGNFFRAGLLVLLLVMFLAAASVLFGVFLSFPIACLSVMTIFIVGMASGFLSDATRLPRSSVPTAYQYFNHYMVRGVFFVIPTFAATSASDSLVDGTYISNRTLTREYLATFQEPQADSSRFWQVAGIEIQSGMGLRTLLAIAVSWLIFRRRELAGTT